MNEVINNIMSPAEMYKPFMNKYAKGHAGEIVSLGWPGEALVFPKTSWRRFPGRSFFG